MGKKSSRNKKTVKNTEVKKSPQQEPPEDPVLREIITGIVGEHGYEMAKEFMKKEITDEKVAKKLGIHVNLVRRVLYPLYENRVAVYRRDRDRQSGWYLYYWRIDPERALEHYNNNKCLLLQKLEERLKAERSTDFFSCGDGGHKLPVEFTMESDFKCPRCGGRMEPYDNSGVVKALEYRIESLRQQLIQNKR